MLRLKVFSPLAAAAVAAADPAEDHGLHSSAATDRLARPQTGVAHGADLRSASRGDTRSLSLMFSAAVLKPHTYTVDVTGVPALGTTELVGSYSFRVMVR